MIKQIAAIVSPPAITNSRHGWSKSLRAAALLSVCFCSTFTASVQWTIIDLGTLLEGATRSEAVGINNAGQVVGYGGNARDAGAFLWQNGVMTGLNTLS
jgi:probable HAF family extracellular repeat protein